MKKNRMKRMKTRAAIAIYSILKYKKQIIWGIIVIAVLVTGLFEKILTFVFATISRFLVFIFLEHPLLLAACFMILFIMAVIVGLFTGSSEEKDKKQKEIEYIEEKKDYDYNDLKYGEKTGDYVWINGRKYEGRSSGTYINDLGQTVKKEEWGYRTSDGEFYDVNGQRNERFDEED